MHSRTIFIISLFIFFILGVTKCINKDVKDNGIIENNKGEKFAGSVTCASCHKKIYDSHVHTAHYLTTRPAKAEYIKGSFDPGINRYEYNPSVAIAMEKRGDSFYQVEYYKTTERKARRIDIVVGSGTMGQSFLNWKDNSLFQLPITYFAAANRWSNSPGFPDRVLFNRPITSRCMECHTTFIKTVAEPANAPEEFDQNKIVYGVDCEKCHGPGAKHVEFQTQNPTATIAKYIINPSRLSRQQNLDLCASCHGGRLQKTKPSFSFTAGDKLSDYYVIDTTTPDPNKIDVHGNQYGLLRSSKCFRLSNKLTCSSCHNTHENEKGKVATFSQRCMNCHDDAHEKMCKLTKSLGAIIKTNCIDCHMPLQSSKAIAVQLHGDSLPTAALIRSHLITVYPDETKKIIDVMKKLKQPH
jgi:Cytochrome c554 and c-prime